MSTNTTPARLERRRSSLRRLVVLVFVTVAAAIAVSAAGAARTTPSIHCVTRIVVGCKPGHVRVRTIFPYFPVGVDRRKEHQRRDQTTP